MAETSFHKAYGVSEDMVTELGDEIFDLSHNKQTRIGDAVREKAGLSEADIESEIAAVRNEK